MTSRIWAAVAITCLLTGLVVVLALDDPKAHASNIVLVLGMLSVVVSSLSTTRTVEKHRDQLDHIATTLKNGGVSEPVKSALRAPDAQESIKRAVTAAIDERDRR